MPTHSHCNECGYCLGRTAVFCHTCGAATCCWRCHDRHLARHAQAAAPTVRPAAEAHASHPAADVQSASLSPSA